MADRWSPYEDNGGTILAMVGRDHVTVACDTRLSRDIAILSRQHSKVVKLTSRVLLASSGQQADIEALWTRMRVEVEMFTFKHRREPTVAELAQRLSVELYSRRFFPYYAFNILAGLDEQGEGVVYCYDAIGNTHPEAYGTAGSASQLIMSVLDMSLRQPHRVDDMQEKPSTEESQRLAVDSLTSAAEVNIETGDSAQVWTLQSDGRCDVATFSLRQD